MALITLYIYFFFLSLATVIGNFRILKRKKNLVHAEQLVNVNG